MNNNLHILMLEDDPSDATLIQLLLSRSGMKFNAVVAGDESEFLSAIEGHRFDVVLADNALPQYSSLEALKIIKEHNPHVAFILVTGTVSEEFAVEIIQHGADDYILKTNLTRLPAAIRKAIERRRMQRDKEMEKSLSDSIINSLPGVFYLIDRNGNFLRWNRNFMNVSGFQQDEIITMKASYFFEEQNRFYVDQWIERVFREGYAETESKIITKDGHPISYFFTGMAASFNDQKCLIGIGLDITERKRTEKELKQLNEELRSVTGHLEKIREEEQTRIAREVHDQLGQQITGLRFDLLMLRDFIEVKKNPEEASKKLKEMLLLLDDTVVTVRKIASALRPSILDDLGLVDALDWQSNEFTKRSGIEVEFIRPEEEIKFDPDIATGLFRIYQEILTNVGRHAEANGVFTTLDVTDDEIVLTVSDDGKGFDSSKKMKSLGLLGMRERAYLIGGTVTITSLKGSGTRVRVVVLKKAVS